jgi:hypothetical protein
MPRLFCRILTLAALAAAAPAACAATQTPPAHANPAPAAAALPVVDPMPAPTAGSAVPGVPGVPVAVAPDPAADLVPQAAASQAEPAVVLDDGVTFNFDTLCETVSLSTDAASLVKERFSAMQKQLGAWERAHADQLADFSDALSDLAGSRDAHALRELVADHLTLLDDRTRLVNAHKEAILALLSSKQRLQWEAAKVRLLLADRLQGIELNDVQEEEVKAIADQRAKDLAQLAPPRDGKAVRRIVGAGWQTVHDTILSAVQRRQLEHPEQPADGGVIPLLPGTPTIPANPGLHDVPGH